MTIFTLMILGETLMRATGISGLRGTLAAVGSLLLTSNAIAAPLLDGFGGPRDYGEPAMGRNDDGSSSELDLPFSINLFGNSYDTFWINNNGNITFESPLWTYTPDPFPVTSQPMIAPYWADVDTRGGAADDSNNVWVASPNASTVVVTWDQVGYYWLATNRRNDFQLVLRDRSADTGTSGDFDIEFRYNILEWTTGDASGGVGGLGGVAAQAGFDAGNGTDFQTLPGSFTPAVIDIQNTTNVLDGVPGLWSFAIRSGNAPGSTPDNPFMPVQSADGWDFDFNVQRGVPVFIDPEYAVGYDYIVNDGPNFASVVLPDVGDGLFDLFLWNGVDWILGANDLAANVTYSFDDAVDRFRVLGIELDAMLDPDDPLAFVTGLTFERSGAVSMSQNPIVAAGPGSVPASVPAPSPLPLFGVGAMALWRLRRGHAR